MSTLRVSFKTAQPTEAMPMSRPSVEIGRWEVCRLPLDSCPVLLPWQPCGISKGSNRVLAAFGDMLELGKDELELHRQLGITGGFGC